MRERNTYACVPTAHGIWFTTTAAAEIYFTEKKEQPTERFEAKEWKEWKKKRATEIVLWAERVECLALPRDE